jgi:secondary thiamine-phosphate synthase enzyme
MILIREFPVGKNFTETSETRGYYTENITETVKNFVSGHSIKNGTATIQSLHTTMGIALNENESGLLNSDFPNMLHKIAPGWIFYTHDNLHIRTQNLDPDHPERSNGKAHCKALLLPTSVTIIIENGNLALGKWQSILLFEFDGPRDNRKIKICLMGE